MKLEHSLHFWIQHNEAIIQWLIVGILVITALWLIRMLTDKPKQASAVKVDLSEIEANLKKLLERAAAIEATPASPTLEQAFANKSGAPDPALKAELEKREKEISELKAQLLGASKTDVTQYTVKITELETKLAEYEILEDDIADLSLYKEENVRLKSELSKLKGEPLDAAPVEEAKKENLVAEFEEAVKQEKAVPAPEVAPAPAAEPVAASVAAPEPVPAPAPAAATSAPTPTPAAAPKPAVAANPGGEADDILAEFAGEGLDTDKMLAEIETLNQAGEADSSALEEDSDMNKMAEEASKLGS